MISSSRHHRNISTGRYKGLPAEKPVRPAQLVEPQPEPKEEIEEIVYGLSMEEAFTERTLQEKISGFKDTVLDALPFCEGRAAEEPDEQPKPTLDEIVDDAVPERTGRIRSWLNNHPLLGLGCILATLAVAGGLTWYTLRGSDVAAPVDRSVAAASVQPVADVGEQPTYPGQSAEPAPKVGSGNKNELEGLAILLYNAEDHFDIFVYNAITGDDRFVHTGGTHRGYKGEGFDKEVHEFDQHTFRFKPTGKRSNKILPERLKRDKGLDLDKTTTLAHFFNNVTRYKGNVVEHVDRIKDMLVENYAYSFGIELDRDKIEIVAERDGKILSVKYKGANRRVKIKTEVATEIAPNPDNPETSYFVASKKRRFSLTNRRGELQFPPSLYTEQSLLVGKDDLKKIPDTVVISHTYNLYSYAGDRTITGKRTKSIDIPISISGLMDVQRYYLDYNQKSRIRIGTDGGVPLYSYNPGPYIISREESLLKGIADIVTENINLWEDQAQALLNFTQSFHYYLETGEVMRLPHLTLLGRGGDCDDATILYASLLQQKGIDSIVIGFEGHVMVGVAGSFYGEGYINHNGKKYYLAETTTQGAGTEAIGPRIGVDFQNLEYRDGQTLGKPVWILEPGKEPILLREVHL